MERSAIRETMQLPGIGNRAPAFTARSSHGEVRFPDEFAGKWVVLFSHVTDFLPSSSDDFLAMSGIEAEFLNNDCRLVGLYDGDVESLVTAVRARREQRPAIQSTAETTPITIIDDRALSVAHTYGMLPPVDVRAYFVIDPNGIIRTILMYHPEDARHIFDGLFRVILALKRLDRAYGQCPELRVHNTVALSM